MKDLSILRLSMVVSEKEKRTMRAAENEDGRGAARSRNNRVSENPTSLRSKKHNMGWRGGGLAAGAKPSTRRLRQIWGSEL